MPGCSTPKANGPDPLTDSDTDTRLARRPAANTAPRSRLTDASRRDRLGASIAAASMATAAVIQYGCQPHLEKAVS